ncbi:Mini-chromosome maintenance complex-binding protein [Durusdinium trenchii]|uniref:Mini-chromosome maintenance complex-binding protein n=1 Tax=Durusdinium trenchii TaxID=1381693 RepID=A0ABP0HF97_9DINO
MGIVIMLAAGVFTALPVYFDLFAYQWYYALCWFWFLLGVALLVFGIAHEARLKLACKFQLLQVLD